MYPKLSKKELREFGIIIGFGFPFFIGFLIPFFSGHTVRYWTLWVGTFGIFLGLFLPNSLYLPYKIWMKLGYLLGWVNSRIILGIVFVFVLQPISIFMKIIGYDPLRKKKFLTKTYKENTSDKKIDLTRIF